MKKLFLFVVLFVFVGVSAAWAQTKIITGTVTSATEGEGTIPGVSVFVKGTTVATATDANGKYTLTVPESATTLVFTFIGMKTEEVEIAGRSLINVTMTSDVVGLDEVVVTAFGIKRQARELGVATAQIDDQELTQASVSNVVNGLTGKVSGLQINTVNNGVNPDTRITLRGNRHFLASNQALIVLDGVPVSATYLNSINPNDIASVNVLKGASAAALYGNDASNGVLVISTRRGSGGKPSIKISNTTTFESVSYMPKLQERFGAGSGEDTVNYPAEYTFWVGPGRFTDPYTSYENQSWGPEFNGEMVILGGVLQDGSYQLIPYSAVPNQKRKFFDTGVSLQNDISYSVGDDKNNFYISFQDVNTTGTIPKDKNRRTGFRVAGARTSGIFRADYSVGYTQTNTDVSGDEYFQQRPVYWNVLNTPAEVDLTNYKDIVNNKFANHNGYFNGYYPNPYWAIENSRNQRNENNLIGSTTLALTPLKWLDISYRGGLIYNTRDDYYFRNGCVFDAYYADNDPWGAGGVTTGSPYVGVSSESLRQRFTLTGDLLVQLNNKFGDFTSKVILGQSIYTNKYRYLAVANNSIVVPFLYNVSNRLGEPGVGQYQENRNSMGVFADVTLGYKNFAFIHASARNDWDSRLTKENRSFFYPGVDASVILTDAVPSLKNNVLTFLKIRGGWSQTGQIALDNWYATLPAFGVGGGFPYGSTTGFGLSTTLSNPLLRPEITQEVEAGFEASLFNDRIHLGVNVYQSNTKDQTIPADISRATGYASAYINAGELQTQGIETDLRLTPVLKLGDFDWNVTVNYTYNTSKVLAIMEGLDELLIGDQSYAVVGEQFPAIKVTDLKRDPDGRIIVDASTGMPIKDSQLKVFGHGNPNHILGITSTFNWKGLSLNIVADYRSGHVIVNQVGADLSFTGNSWFSAQNGRQNFVIPNSVVQVGNTFVENTDIITKTAAQKFWYNGDINQVLSTYVTSAAFWKLREVSLNYSIPVQNILNGAIKDAQIGIVGRNLFMIRPVTNVWTDPEFNSQGGTSNAVGYTTVYQTPPTRIYGFSVKLTF